MATDWLCSSESPERPAPPKRAQLASTAEVPAAKRHHVEKVLEPLKRNAESWCLLQRNFLQKSLEKRGRQLRSIRIGTACSGLGTPTRALQVWGGLMLQDSGAVLRPSSASCLCLFLNTRQLKIQARCKTKSSSLVTSLALAVLRGRLILSHIPSTGFGHVPVPGTLRLRQEGASTESAREDQYTTSLHRPLRRCQLLHRFPFPTLVQEA